VTQRHVRIAPLACLTAAALGAAVAGPAVAHQTAYDRGTAVTLHVAPDDEPVAGQPATIVVTRVRPPRRGVFRFATCSCRVRVQDSAGHVLLDRRTGKRTPFTFPAAAAYRITYSGNYRRAGKRRTFHVSFSLRAIAS
jgi:hypothetical protein